MQRQVDSDLERAQVDEQSSLLSEKTPLLSTAKSSTASNRPSIRKRLLRLGFFIFLALSTIFYLASSFVAEHGRASTLAFNGPPALMHDGAIIKGVVLDNNQEAWYGES